MIPWPHGLCPRCLQHAPGWPSPHQCSRAFCLHGRKNLLLTDFKFFAPSAKKSQPFEGSHFYMFIRQPSPFVNVNRPISPVNEHYDLTCVLPRDTCAPGGDPQITFLRILIRALRGKRPYCQIISGTMAFCTPLPEIQVLLRVPPVLRNEKVNKIQWPLFSVGFPKSFPNMVISWWDNNCWLSQETGGEGAPILVHT